MSKRNPDIAEMKGKIVIGRNLSKKLNENKFYYFFIAEDSNFSACFTACEFTRANNRMKNNIEDLELREGIWKKIKRFLFRT